MSRGRAAAPFYKNEFVSICYEEAGSGYPLLGGGLNSTMAALKPDAPFGAPFNPMTDFTDEYRCITADLCNRAASL